MIEFNFATVATWCKAGEFVVSTADPRPSGPDPVISLQCSSWRSFAERYVDDLARGAMCLPHAEPMPLLQTLTVKLALPDALDITLSARVVQVLTGAHAEQLGSPYALALEILDLDVESKRQLSQLVEFARSQRDGDDEHTSFARTMLEHTPSLPPREVGLRLSLIPSPPSAAAPKRSTPADSATTGESGYRHTSATARLRSHSDVTRPLSPSRTMRAIQGKGAELSGPPRPNAASAPAPDPDKVKELLSSVARKQYDAALRLTNELLEENPSDRQAQRWRALCYARIALSRDDHALAAQAYETMLEIEPNDREAREFLKAHERTKKLESLPFGRFFTKKK
jgi:tetratricopeptide (TPR) repeat protein